LNPHDHFCFIAISYFALSALQNFMRSPNPGRCPGLLHFAPSALSLGVLTQTLKGRAKFNRRSAAKAGVT
jgi:hypothetical protein